MQTTRTPSANDRQSKAADAAETLRQIGDVAGISVWTWHAATDRVYHSATTIRGEALDQGIPLAEMLARLHPGDRARIKRRLHAAVRSGKSGAFRFRSAPHDNDIRQLNATHFPVGPNEVQVIVQDVTRMQRAEQALRESEAFSRSILEASTMAIEVLDAEGRLIFMNGPGIRIMEVRDFEAIKGLPFETFWPEDLKQTIREAIAAARRGETVRHTLFGPTAKGKARWWDLSISPILNDRGGVERLLALSRDVTEAKYAEAEIAHLARHDALTGLPNRMHFQEQLEAALDGLAEDKLAVVSVDLDDFKLVNDTMGHQAGDLLLREVAERLRLSTDGGGLVARLGGDEFAFLLTVLHPDEAAATAQSILSALTRPFQIEGEAVHIGASIGIAIAPRDGTTADALLHHADVAMYRVKAEKGRGYRYFEPAMDEALRKRREMKRDLSLALGRGELSVVYQPQIDIAANRLIGFEALLRWECAAHGVVSPMVFIPLAEESGVIDEIGAFVLEEACREAAQWPEEVSVAVNLSPAQFRSRGVVTAVWDALGRTGLSASRLELEITESVLLDESAEALAALKELHGMGIRVALDDFGTGYSSLSYLRRFPFDKIKIDRSFIADLPGAEDSAAIVRAIIGLGRSLKTRVTAEGVENWEQLLLLRAEGCNQAQGYLFSRPLLASQARAMAASGVVAPLRSPEPQKRHA